MLGRGFRHAVILGALAVLGGCTGFYRPPEGPMGTAHRPRLEAAWAQEQIGFSSMWRIYIRATDPDGDLDKVWVTFTRFGGTYPGTFVYLPAGQRRTANGYIQVWARPKGGLNLSELPIYAAAEVRVEDRAGNQSEAIAFPFVIVVNPLEDKGEPPAGFTREARLTEMDMNMEIDLGAGDGDRSGGGF